MKINFVCYIFQNHFVYFGETKYEKDFVRICMKRNCLEFGITKIFVFRQKSINRYRKIFPSL